jgi:hypothetical protein
MDFRFTTLTVHSYDSPEKLDLKGGEDNRVIIQSTIYCKGAEISYLQTSKGEYRAKGEQRPNSWTS